MAEKIPAKNLSVGRQFTHHGMALLVTKIHSTTGYYPWPEPAINIDWVDRNGNRSGGTFLSNEEVEVIPQSDGSES